MDNNFNETENTEFIHEPFEHHSHHHSHRHSPHHEHHEHHEHQEQEKKHPVLENILDFLEIFAFSACFVLILFTFFVRLARVEGPSMENTLIDGEVLLVSNFMYEPQPDDIVVFYELNDYYKEPIVKRVIALEGQTVDIDFSTWTLKVDGEVTDEPYIKLTEGIQLTAGIDFPYQVPKGCIFVLGDNRNHSTDSRSPLIGPVDTRKVIGKVILRISPLSRFGTVE